MRQVLPVQTEVMAQLVRLVQQDQPDRQEQPVLLVRQVLPVQTEVMAQQARQVQQEQQVQQE